MDDKAKSMLQHYKEIFEKRLFNEYDVSGFLITIRSYLDKTKYPIIHDFADLVAHRNRDRGRAMESIENAKKNGYVKKDNSNCIKGHRGIDYPEWESEWLNLGRELAIQFTPSIIRELGVCVCSIAQLTEYSRDKYSGKVELFRHENSVFLATTEGKPGSRYICYFNVYEDSLKNPNQEYFEPVKRPVVAIREEGVLKIKEAN